MSKPKLWSRPSTSTDTVKSWISNYPDLTFDGNELLCNVCNVRLSTSRKSVVTKHVSSKTHIELKTLGHQKKQTAFHLDLVKFMVGCNIPWEQLNNPVFREFIENCLGGQYTDAQLLKSSTLRKTYLPQLAENVIANICTELKGKHIWVSVDETTNAHGLKVANVLVGILDELQASRAHLLAWKVLDASNAETIATLVHDSLKLLWKDRYDQNKNKFVLFISNDATYMKSAGLKLQETYAVLHVTCLAHALHRVAETVRECYPNVDMLISSINKVFLKAPERRRLFTELAPETPLPPTPVETRCGTWLEAAAYYLQHFGDVQRVLQQMDATQAVAIANAQRSIMDHTVRQNLQDIHNWFSKILLAIQQLERRPQPGRAFIDSMNIIYDLRHYISLLTCDSAHLVQRKLDNVLRENPGYVTLCCIEKLLRDQEVDCTALGIKEACLQQYSLYRYAPTTSIDIERTFTIYKWIFSDKRRVFSPSNLENILRIYFYYCNAPSTD